MVNGENISLMTVSNRIEAKEDFIKGDKII
jgi:hypothetical protein